jgi:hypothetical protein
MALNVANFKDALFSALESNTTLTTLIGQGDIDPRTNQTSERVFESFPNFTGVVPAITFTILDVNPLTPDDPTNGHYNTLVLVNGVGSTQEEANILGDQIQSMFTDRPEFAPRNWFLDISTDCITSKHTKFISRLRSGRHGISRSNDETDTYTDVIEVNFLWHNCPCDELRCEDTCPTVCPLDYETEYTDYDQSCDC